MFKGFQKPKRLVANTESLTERFGQFTAQPFERGFGSTIGTGLRRVLLSSIEGAAITGVRIDGVSHEFSPIPGVVEDATDIILNLKQVPFKMMGEGTRIARLTVDAPGEVMSSQIETDNDIEVLDRNLHIATVGEGGKLNIEMRIKSGRGYVSADRNYDEDLPIGYIPIDSVHSPVRKVNYTVEAARLGQNTDYDKLTIEVWTNGAISPQDAVGQAAKLLKDHMTIFINFEESPEVAEEPAERAINQMNEVLNRSVEELELSVRSYNCLKNANIQTIGDLVQKIRIGNAAHQEFRPQIAERNQRDSFGPRSFVWHEVRRAGPPGRWSAAGVSRRFRRCSNNTGQRNKPCGTARPDSNSSAT